MIIFPAIDLYEHKAVRLLKGDYGNLTVYNDDPAAAAKEFEEKGAEYVHLVDLEGAKNGDTPNISTVSKIVNSTSLFSEIGGGIRSMDTVKKYFDIGVSRVILGTAAVENRDFLLDAVDKYSDRIAVSADVRDGFIAIKGWIEKSAISLNDFLEDMQNIGVKTVICTDISKDGAMNGTNLELYSEITKKYNMNITASGGVSTMEDIKKLAAMDIYGAIIGKAYYTGAIDLTEAIEAAK